MGAKECVIDVNEWPFCAHVMNEVGREAESACQHERMEVWE